MNNTARFKYHNLYNSKQWKALRSAQLSMHPLCAMCEAQGLITGATIADHIKPHKGDKTLFLNPSNLQSLCKLCHDKHKKLFETRGVILGADITGAPLDSASHWYN